MKKAFLLSLIALAFVLGFTAKKKVIPDESPRPQVPTRTAPDLSPSNDGGRVSSTRPSTRKDATATESERSDAVDRIEEAITTYSPEGVRSIAEFLEHPDPEIRAAARDGLIQIGEPNGIGPLRLAALRMSDPAEVTACREAADLLELPSWSETEEARELVTELVNQPASPPTDP